MLHLQRLRRRKRTSPRPKKVRASSCVEVYFAGSLSEVDVAGHRCPPPSWRHLAAHTPKSGRTVRVWTFDVHVPNFGALRVDFAARHPFFPCSADVRQLVVLESSVILLQKESESLFGCNRW